ncbi:MAG: hypothetical protein C7B47_00235 [Sulfobacillus thermosulfidooxidans]|nr:2OG-Fe(II) oxygenase [Sulfobacillus thermosulfidooxidans]PSR29774.1 MAG: hypothetical protein C7B47_00235 [Sulfobacillus thermosulfidooxidans]
MINAVLVGETMLVASQRFERVNWSSVEWDIRQKGYSIIPKWLTKAECYTLRDLWQTPDCFCPPIEMEHHHFGYGQYRYFHYPLPEFLRQLREKMYPYLRDMAHHLWDTPKSYHYPETLDEFLDICHNAGQNQAGVMMLHYPTGGYNLWHQDRHGSLLFPLQIILVLSESGHDFEGGKLLVQEEYAHKPPERHIIGGNIGDVVVLCTASRPKHGHGPKKSEFYHGVSKVTAGERYSLSCLFHDE